MEIPFFPGYYTLFVSLFSFILTWGFIFHKFEKKQFETAIYTNFLKHWSNKIENVLRPEIYFLQKSCFVHEVSASAVFLMSHDITLVKCDQGEAKMKLKIQMSTITFTQIKVHL